LVVALSVGHGASPVHVLVVRQLDKEGAVRHRRIRCHGGYLTGIPPADSLLLAGERCVRRYQPDIVAVRGRGGRRRAGVFTHLEVGELYRRHQSRSFRLGDPAGVRSQRDPSIVESSAYRDGHLGRAGWLGRSLRERRPAFLATGPRMFSWLAVSGRRTTRPPACSGGSWPPCTDGGGPTVTRIIVALRR
jgi:hypothetical protein